MPISKNKKAEIIEELGKRIGSSETVVFVNFHGLPVSQVTELRRQLRDCGVGYTVVKKTLIPRVFTASRRVVAGAWPSLGGEIALTYLTDPAGDPIAPAKGIYEFQKLVKEGLKILGGVWAGAFADAVTMMGIAAIPPRETLYAQLANLFNSPIQRLVVVLDQISKTKV
ncbi:MAG: 50S ribosomal protein L10 [Patescibacteria group bacterium]